MKFDYDLFVIGAGSGGVRLSRMAAAWGAHVAIAEESRVGGTCVIRGCVPKKLLVYASHYQEEMEDAEGYGWHFEQGVFSWNTLIDRKNREINRLNGVYHIMGAAGEIRVDVAVTVGLAQYCSGESARQLFRRVDESMYRQKHLG